MPPLQPVDLTAATSESTLVEGVSLKGLGVRFKTDCTMVEAGSTYEGPSPQHYARQYLMASQMDGGSNPPTYTISFEIYVGELVSTFEVNG